MNRRSIIVLLIGVLATVGGLTAATLLERDRCLDAGGRWVAAARQCWLASDVSIGFGMRSIAIGVVVALLAAVMLYRAFLFFERGRAPRP